MDKEGLPERIRYNQDLTQVRKGAGSSRGPGGGEKVALFQHGVGVSKEVCHWSNHDQVDK